MDLSRIDVLYAHIDVTAVLYDNTPATLTGVDVALLAPRTTPDADTVWTASVYTTGTAVILLAGPEAVEPAALTVPIGGVDLWIRVTDTPEIDAARVARITVT